MWKLVVFVIMKYFGYKVDMYVKVKRSVFNWFLEILKNVVKLVEFFSGYFVMI